MKLDPYNNVDPGTMNPYQLRLSCILPKHNLVEIIELKEHPYFIAVQFHPEFKSKPDRAHPLFREFIRSALKIRK